MSEIFTSTYLDKCVISNHEVVPVLNLGQHAYADTFIGEEQVGWSEPVFPLQVNLCPESGHLQLGYVSHAEERYNLYSYSYTSSNSATARRHWDEYADEVKTKYSPDNLVVEIGSNDGYLVGQFQDSCAVLGVDLSTEMCDIAGKKGITTLNAAFGEDLAKSIVSQQGHADVVMANNVLNHANDPIDFVRGSATLIGDNGVFIFEVPYWLVMVQSGRFVDMVYHEHISYFTVKSVQTMLEQADLIIKDVKIVNYHGGSLRVTATHKSNNCLSPYVSSFIAKEIRDGLFDKEFYEKLTLKFQEQRAQWLRDFYDLKLDNPGVPVIGVGAAAKANTWLTWHGLSKNDLDYVTDSSEFKQGKYTPLSRIPITGDEIFANYDQVIALILSWNIGGALKDNLLKINPNITFISQ